MFGLFKKIATNEKTIGDYIVMALFSSFLCFIIVVLIFGFISINRITINELYMRFFSHEVVNCSVDLTKTKQYSRSKDYIFHYKYYKL